MKDELPPGWALASLRSIVGPLGLMTDGDWIESKDQDPDGEVRLIQLADVGSGRFIDKSRRFLTRLKAGELGCTFLKQGDLLISRLGNPLGKACLFPALDQPCITAVDIHIVRTANALISRSWLVHIVNSAPVRRVIESQSSGTTRKRITGRKLKETQLPVPPAVEQGRIASKIDELFSRIDEGEAALARVEKLVERYRQSVLKAAVTGELTRDWRAARKRAGEPVESGEALLARILKARRAAWETAELAKLTAKGKPPTDGRWKQKYQEPAPPDTTDLPALPEGWVWATVEQLCFVETGATPKRGNTRFYEGGTINWITSAAVNARLIVSAEERITGAAIKETNAKVFAAGSLIVAMYGEGKTRGKVSELAIPAATNQACAVLLCGYLDACVKAYVKVFLEKNYLALRSAAAGGVQPNLNLSIIRTLPVALPSIPEQAVILSHVSKVASSIEVTTQGCTKEMHRSTALRQSILKAAFSGQLVPQDPRDEPAWKLLERIAAERAAAPATQRGRRPKAARL